MKLPYLDLYIGDWLKDAVSGCSLASQGLWLRLLFIMQESKPRGYLCLPEDGQEPAKLQPMPVNWLARKCGCQLEEYQSLLVELEQSGVPSKTESGVIYSRRIVRDEQIRIVRSAAGSRGGRTLAGMHPKQNSSKPSSKTQANAGTDDGTGTEAGTDLSTRKGKGSREAVMAFCKEIGLPESDGDYFFNKCEGNGWLNAGKPIKDWKATIRAWKTAGYLPSLKGGNGQQPIDHSKPW